MSNSINYSGNRALVLGVDDRSGLTVCRSLGRKGITVHQGCDSPRSIIRHSKYVNRVIDLPPVTEDAGAWLEALMAHLATEKYDLVIPTADNYLVPIIRNREKLEPLAKFAIPDNRGFEYTYRKGKTFALAEKLGVPIPRTIRLEHIDQLADLPEAFRPPLIIKPVSSKVITDRGQVSMDVTLVHDQESLEKTLDKVLSFCPVLLQTFHSGVGLGQEVLMRDGQLVAAFQHERVHEPLSGGGSSYRKSSVMNKELLKHSLAMLEDLKWTGVAMVEYKYDRKRNESVLMEINGRFWGSLPLAISAGVDFPGMLFDMLVHDVVPDKPVNYRPNIYCRNFAKDFDWLKENIRADKSDPFKLTVPLPKVAAEVWHFLTFREHFDTLPLDDLKPGFVHIGRYINGNFQGAKSKLYKAGLRLNLGRNIFKIKARQRLLKKLLRKNPSVNFVCKGNICRSPFAEFYLRDLFMKNNMNGVDIESSGLIERVNRKSPDNAIAAAHEQGIDMTSHRSKLLTARDFEKYGALFVMDTELYERIVLMYPQAKKNLFFLGELADGYPKQLEIVDPYGKKLDFFNKTYRQIIAPVKLLFNTIQDLKQK